MTGGGIAGANELAGWLRAPERLALAGPREWDRIIPQARKAGLLARIAIGLEAAGGLASLDPRVRAHLVSAQNLAEKHKRDVRFELDRIAELLEPIFGRIILLKGAAYLAADLPPSRGRVFSDIDILIPRSQLADAESILRFGGWRFGEIDAYDEQYYRRWMHQLPPLVNPARDSMLDVHHTIIPATAPIALDAGALLAAAVPVSDRQEFAVLAPPDMVLHSAVHLFNEGEFGRGLRDLDDLNLLMRHFGSDAGFWEALMHRAQSLDLMRPLFYALRYSSSLLGTPVPSEVKRLWSDWSPPVPMRFLMDALFSRALRSPHPESQDGLTGTALWLLYARAHYLRMPLRLLVPHLSRKALRRGLDRQRPAAP